MSFTADDILKSPSLHFSPCLNGGSCLATAAGVVECACTEGHSGERCEVSERTRARVSASGDVFDWSFVPRFHGGEESFAELPTLRHVGREEGAKYACASLNCLNSGLIFPLLLNTGPGKSGFVKFVPAVAYHFCLNLPATFSQPRTSIISGPNRS